MMRSAGGRQWPGGRYCGCRWYPVMVSASPAPTTTWPWPAA